MCLAVPMRIEDVRGQWARAVAAETAVPVNLSLIEDPKEGDYVLVHAGFAIQRLDEDEARKTLDILDAIGATEGRGGESPADAGEGNRGAPG